MPDHLARVRPFLPSSLLRVGRRDEIAAYESAEDGGSAEECMDGAEDGAEENDGSQAVVYNDFMLFILSGKWQDGPATCYYVRKQSVGWRTASDLVVTSVCIPNGDKFATLLRFYDDFFPQ